MPPEIAEAVKNSTSQGETLVERERRMADISNRSVEGKLTGYDCPKCLNRGFFYRVRDNGERYNEACECMEIRRNMRYMRESGLSDIAERYTFDNWVSRLAWQDAVVKMAREYAAGPSGWFYLAGNPGTGKTHLCTAICGELMRKGYRTRYMLWRDVSVRAKAVVNDEEAYQELVVPLKKVRVLYIDDLFKTGKGAEPTTGDVNLAFEILNARYNDERMITILSSERTINDILSIDEGVGSRIFQRSKNNYADLTGKENWRLREANNDH